MSVPLAVPIDAQESASLRERIRELTEGQRFDAVLRLASNDVIITFVYVSLWHLVIT